MLKRLIRAGLAWCLLACLCLQPAALAATTINPTSAQSAQITATYEQPQSYTITIPDNISIGTPFTVTASNVVVPYGKKAQVTVESRTNDWNLVHVDASQWKLIYALKSGEEELVPINKVLTLCSFAALPGAETATYSFTTVLKEPPKVAGEYQDTLTFTVSIVDDPNP